MNCLVLDCLYMVSDFRNVLKYKLCRRPVNIAFKVLAPDSWFLALKRILCMIY